VNSWRARVYSAIDEVLCEVETDPVHWVTNAQSVEASTGGFYRGKPYAAYQPGKGILLGTGIDPVLEWYDLDGQHMETIRLDIPPEPVTSEERATLHTRLDKQIEDAPNDIMREIYEEEKRIAEIPDAKGFWCELSVDESGFIWAQKPYPYYLDEYPERSIYKIISPEGEYLGETVVPAVTGWVSRGHYLSLQQDEETGLPILTVYRIRPAVPGLDYPQE
jgi:hypothetical protein